MSGACAEEFPTFELAWIPVLTIPCGDVVYGFPGEFNALNAAHRVLDEVWKVVEALLDACGSPFESSSQL